jgi:hypothetical protein
MAGLFACPEQVVIEQRLNQQLTGTELATARLLNEDIGYAFKLVSEP